MEHSADIQLIQRVLVHPSLKLNREEHAMAQGALERIAEACKEVSSDGNLGSDQEAE